MFVRLKNIQVLFSHLPNFLTNSNRLLYLTGWKTLDSKNIPYATHSLHVCEYSNILDDINYSEGINILCIVDQKTDFEMILKKIPEQNNLLLIKHDNPMEIYQELENYFNIQNGISMFGHTLLDFLSFENDLQSAIDYSFTVFGNPIFLFDTNYNLVAATWDAINDLNINDQVVTNKRFSPQDFKMANRQNNIHNKVRKSEIPIKSFNEELGYEQIYCAINTKKDLGHIVVSSVNKPFEPLDSELLLILKKYVDLQLKSDSFVRNAKGFNYEFFLKDLLDKKIASSQGFLSQLNYVKNEFSGNMYCMVIETARSISLVNNLHIRSVIESRFPFSKSIVYNDQIITIISVKSNQLLSNEYIVEAQRICTENDLYAGLSNCFQNIIDLLEYYSQALRAIELGTYEKNEPNLFLYQNYSLNHIKNIFTQKESPKTFCHPKIKFLMDYDKIHNSELAYTLYMYLVNERNLVATSEAMNMHRTSLVYRFKKINSLIDDDFDDYKERMYMILSYELFNS